MADPSDTPPPDADDAGLPADPLTALELSEALDLQGAGRMGESIEVLERVLTREVILDRVWGMDAQTSSNGVEVYVGYLRRKLEADDRPRLIETVRGVGYVLRTRS